MSENTQFAGVRDVIEDLIGEIDDLESSHVAVCCELDSREEDLAQLRREYDILAEQLGDALASEKRWKERAENCRKIIAAIVINLGPDQRAVIEAWFDRDLAGFAEAMIEQAVANGADRASIEQGGEYVALKVVKPPVSDDCAVCGSSEGCPINIGA